ncbi:uncharacterized protein LOC125285544 [Alosa alosa]|uniref:uncharacterized protein LOC125285544 n=1 Tax=Alosa alosa TaxID=278164 RepID=UPI0020152C9B|nr:uncharacterized protein LOC125285544 [Alosa alosa]
MAASTREDSSGSSIPDRFSVERALELLGLIDGDNSDLDMSDNDDPILDGNYQPSPQEESSSENEGDSSDDEDPIPEPTDHSKGRKCLRGAGSWTGTETGTGTGSSRTLRRPHQTQEIEADSSEDDLEEPTPRPSQTKNKKKGDSEQGRGICWKATPLTPNLAEYQHQDKTDLDRHGWTPLHYFEQYIDIDLMTIIAECSNIMSLSKSGEPLNMTVDEVYHFFWCLYFDVLHPIPNH